MLTVNTMKTQQLQATAQDTFLQLADETRETVQLQLGELAHQYRCDEVVEWTQEEHCCGFSVYHLDDPLDDPTLSVQFTLANAQHHDDVREGTAGWGLNILVDLLADGYIINSQAPFNNTDAVWTADPDELIRRIESVDPTGIAHVALEHLLQLSAS